MLHTACVQAGKFFHCANERVCAGLQLKDCRVEWEDDNPCPQPPRISFQKITRRTNAYIQHVNANCDVNILYVFCTCHCTNVFSITFNSVPLFASSDSYRSPNKAKPKRNHAAVFFQKDYNRSQYIDTIASQIKLYVLSI